MRPAVPSRSHRSISIGRFEQQVAAGWSATSEKQLRNCRGAHGMRPAVPSRSHRSISIGRFEQQVAAGWSATSEKQLRNCRGAHGMRPAVPTRSHRTEPSCRHQSRRAVVPSCRHRKNRLEEAAWALEAGGAHRHQSSNTLASDSDLGRQHRKNSFETAVCARDATGGPHQKSPKYLHRTV